MNAIKRLVVGESTEATIKLLFDTRIAQESNEGAINAMDRALQITDLRNQILSFIKRNPGSKFELEIPEYNVGKVLKLQFNNYPELETEEDEVSRYNVIVDDSFTKCKVSQKVELGKDIELTLIAQKK